MKSIKVLIALLTVLLFSWSGCSNEQQSPVSSDNQSSILLQKNIKRYFESTEGPDVVKYPPPSTLMNYEERFADGNRFVSYTEHTFFNATFAWHYPLVHRPTSG